MGVTQQSMLDKFFKVGVGLLAWCTVVWMLLKAADYLIAIVVLFGLSLLFTYILLAPVNLLEAGLRKVFQVASQTLRLSFLRKRMPYMLPRAVSILLVYLSFALLVLMMSVRFMPTAVEQLNQFANEIPKYTHQAEEWILDQAVSRKYFHQEIVALWSKGQLTRPEVERIQQEARQANQVQMQSLPALTPTEKQVIRKKVFGTSDQINGFLKEHIGSTFSNLMKVISTTLAGFVYALTGLVLVFYFLLDGADLKEGFVEMLPRESQASVNYILSNMHAVMYGFVKGQVMLGMATGIFMIIIYSLFGVPYALFLGGFFAIAEILPVVGTWLGFIPGILVLLFMDPVKLLMVMALVYVYQAIKDNIVAPRVLGQVVGLHPVIVIVSLLVCAKVAGLVGVLFAIPFASMVNVLIRFFQQKELEQFTA